MEIRIESIGATTHIYTETIAPTGNVNTTDQTEATSFQEKLDSEINAATSAESTTSAANTESAATSSEETSTGSTLLDSFFAQASDLYRIDEGLLKAIGKVESSFNPNSVSSAGAMGIMQLMPKTAEAMGVTNAFDAQQNILGGAKYFRELLNRFNGDISLSLAAYNAGPTAVANAGGIPISAQGYVDKVLANYNQGVTIPQSASDAVAVYYTPGATSTTSTASGNTGLSGLSDAELQSQLEKLLYEYSRREGGTEAISKIVNGISS